MPYPKQYGFKIDNAKTLNMNIMKQSGYIMPGYVVIGQLTWNENFKICAAVKIEGDQGKMKLSYSLNGEDFDYKIQIVSRVSNLDKTSLIWLFQCPFTQRTCRKLYFNGKQFMHRTGIDGMYKIQAMSRRERESEELLGYFLGPNDIYKLLNQKNLKKNYKGGLTKKYAKLLVWKRRVDRITVKDVEWLFITGSLPSHINDG